VQYWWHTEIPHLSCFNLMLWVLLSKRAWSSLWSDWINTNACWAYHSETHLIVTHQNQSVMSRLQRKKLKSISNAFHGSVFGIIAWKKLHAWNLSGKIHQKILSYENSWKSQVLRNVLCKIVLTKNAMWCNHEAEHTYISLLIHYMRIYSAQRKWVHPLWKVTF